MLTRVEGVGEAPIFRGDPRLPETDMDKWINSLLVESYGPKARPYLYGADAGLCARRNVLLEHNEWLGGEKSAATQAYMAVGVALEGMYAKALHRADKLIAQQFRLPVMPEVFISGYIDLVHFDSKDELCITEVKTCGKLPEEANPVHLAQVQLYAAVSGIPRAWLTYISREVRAEFSGRLSLRTFPVDCSELALKARLQTAALSRLAADRSKLPPVPATFRKHTECHYCEFRDAYCWGARPGLGGAGAEPPLLLLTPKELIGLDRDSEELARSMISNSALRYREVLGALKDIAISNSLLQDTIMRLEYLRTQEWEKLFLL